MIARRATHGVVIGVNWVEASIAVPGLIEVDAIAGLREQVLGLFGVVANTVVGTVGHNAVRRFLPGFTFGQRAFADLFLQCFRLHFLRVDRPDNAVPVAAWHHIHRFCPGEDKPLLDGFMAVTIQHHDVVVGHTSLHDGAVRAGSPDHYGPGAVSAKHAGGIFFALAKRAGMIQQRAERCAFNTHVATE